MSTPLTRLGLRPDADERSVKRAYALRLRQVRPDVDPIGFQHLNETYQDALEWLRRRDAGDAPPLISYHEELRFERTEVEQPAEAPAPPVVPETPALELSWAQTPDPTPTPPNLAQPVEIGWDRETQPNTSSRALPELGASPRIAFDFDAFFHALAEQASHGDADALRDWLHRQPPLWSLAIKAATARELMPALYRWAPPLPDRGLDVILAFFDLDHVLSGQNVLQLGVLRRRLHMEWLLQQRDTRELNALLRATQPPVSLEAERLRALVSGPFRWFAVLWNALPPGRPTEVANFVRQLEDARIETLPPRFDRWRLVFWRRAGDRTRLRFARIAVTAARFAFALLLGVLIDSALYLSGESPLMTRLVAYACVGGVMYYLGIALMQWQGAAQSDDRPGLPAWWRLAFVPLLAIVAVAVHQFDVSGGRSGNPTWITPAAAGVASLAAVVAFLRYRRRAGLNTFGWLSGFVGWRLIFLVPLLKAMVLLLAGSAVYAEIPAAIAVALWSADLWRQRGNLRASLFGVALSER